MNKTKALCQLLGIRHPFIQGGMIGVAMAELAAAVSNAGGLGQISAGGVPPLVLRDEIRRAKRLTDRPFGVNVPLRDGDPNLEQLQVAIEEGVAAVSLSGNPKPFMPLLKESVVVILQLVASVKHARTAAEVGAHVVIAEGYEAAGNNGVFELTTMAIIPQVVDAVDIPVVAAGGIADGRAVMAAFALGAAGVQLGTRLVVADECSAHPAYKKALLDARDVDTAVIGRLRGIVRRVLRTPLTEEVLRREREGATLEEITAYCRGERGIAAAMRGELDRGLVYAGQAAGLVKDTGSAAAIFQDILAQAERVRRLLAAGDLCL